MTSTPSFLQSALAKITDCCQLSEAVVDFQTFPIWWNIGHCWLSLLPNKSPVASVALILLWHLHPHLSHELLQDISTLLHTPWCWFYLEVGPCSSFYCTWPLCKISLTADTTSSTPITSKSYLHSGLYIQQTTGHCLQLSMSKIKVTFLLSIFTFSPNLQVLLLLS